VLSIDIEETIQKIMSNNKSGSQLLAMLMALDEDDDNHTYKATNVV